jgi:hypothetical protein
VYDKCDVCNGNSSTCLDCAGHINGATVYDVCDICGGNGSTCRDCMGIPNGVFSCVCVDVCTHISLQARINTSLCACRLTAHARVKGFSSIFFLIVQCIEL